MKRILKDYFTFSKKERMAVIILLLLIISCMLLPYFYRVKSDPPKLNKALIQFIAESKTGAKMNEGRTDSINPLYASKPVSKALPLSLFLFDPNTVSADGWIRLGLPERTIRTILNYRAKGGRFRAPEDLRKIWGINQEEADRLIPYIRIQEKLKDPIHFDNNYVRNQRKNPGIIDINTASTEDWEALPGIGPVLAARIINYRERIGGFADVRQIKKTYGINDSVFTLISPYLTAPPANIPLLDLNTVTIQELKMRTGISEAVAKSIVLYRKQYGPFLAVADVKKIIFINDSLFHQIAIHVKVN